MYKKGDKVRCIYNEDSDGYLKVGYIYTVVRVFPSTLKLESVEGNWSVNRFILAPKKRVRLPEYL